MNTDLKYIDNQIKRVISGQTKTLDLFHLKLNEIPEDIFNLITLEELILNKTSIKKLSPLIGNLINLRYLKLDDNYIENIPEEIGRLTNLIHLSIQNNRISKLPNGITKLITLKTLNLADNELESLVPHFENLHSLKVLQLQGNKFHQIPKEIYGLQNIEHIYFEKDINQNIFQKSRNQNFLKEISSDICSMEKLKTFHVEPKYFQFPSPEIVIRGVQDIKRFFLQLEAEGSDYLYEAKLLIVGEPGAGKTTLFRKLFNIEAPLPNDSETTRGIAIDKYNFVTPEGNNFHVNVWDFGGQEIYHSTHQFFLTKRSLYCMVCDTRKEDTSYNYWLQVIELLSDSCPIFIVHNEKQDRVRDINIGALRKRFLNLKDQIQRTNFETKRGLKEIINLIRTEVARLPHVGDKLPKTWIRVRKAIEEISAEKRYITDDEFYEICEFNGISDPDIARQLSNYLHDLGVFLHFKDGSILERTIILSNTWATEAVYLVLDEPKIQVELKGSFQKEDLKDIWNKDGYLKKKEELLALMLKFELCYKVENSNIYIIPQLLPISEPSFDWDVEDSLQFRFSYEFMPKGIIARLIVRLHRYITNNRLIWREGAVLEKDNERALIKESYSNREIQIFVTGNQPRIFLTIIAEELDKINSSFPKISVEKKIPCNCSLCRNSSTPYFYDYEALLRRLQHDRLFIECPISFENVSVPNLIKTTFESNEERNYRLRRKKWHDRKEKSGVFISYCHKDVEWLNSLKRHLNVIKDKIAFWDDSEIQTGDKWKKEIENAISASRVAILILSADFFNSNFIRNFELPKILLEAENEGTIIYTILLKPCLIEEFPDLCQYQFINSPENPIIEMSESDRENTWIKVVKEIKRFAK